MIFGNRGDPGFYLSETCPDWRWFYSSMGHWPDLTCLESTLDRPDLWPGASRRWEMTGREAELVRARCNSIRRTSKDWVDVASSLEAKDASRSVRDLTHPPSVKKTMRATGVALAVAPEPITTVAGVALVAGSFAVKGEPATLKTVAEELRSQMPAVSDLDLGDLNISI